MSRVLGFQVNQTGDCEPQTLHGHLNESRDWFHAAMVIQPISYPTQR